MSIFGSTANVLSGVGNAANSTTTSPSQSVANSNYTLGQGLAGGVSGSIVNGITCPSYMIGSPGTSYYWQPPATPIDEITIRKVENGFVLKMDGKEYIIADNKQVVKYLDLCQKKVREIK